jgi:uncharacterized protein (DUF983 family)
MAGMDTAPRRPVFRSIARGLAGKCPNCGKGRLFYRYLKVEPVCQTCGCDLDAYPSDDGPAYFTVLLVGHLTVVPFLIIFWAWVWKAPIALVLSSVLIAFAAVTLTALPRIKGAVIGLHHALNITRADARWHTADAAE